MKQKPHGFYEAATALCAVAMKRSLRSHEAKRTIALRVP